MLLCSHHSVCSCHSLNVPPTALSDLLHVTSQTGKESGAALSGVLWRREGSILPNLQKASQSYDLFQWWAYTTESQSTGDHSIVTFKSVTILLKCSETSDPSSLQVLVWHLVPGVKTKHGEAAFCFYAPHAWNKLPENLRSASMLWSFKSGLKIFVCQGLLRNTGQD